MLHCLIVKEKLLTWEDLKLQRIHHDSMKGRLSLSQISDGKVRMQLHMTLLKTKSQYKGPPSTIDVAQLLTFLGHTKFGTQEVDSLHLSRRDFGVEQGYHCSYPAEEIVKFP
eukprot:Filipodium_phascolosomae@DN7205_c0_g1_i1.p1